MEKIIEVPKPSIFLQSRALFLRAKRDPLSFFTSQMNNGKQRFISVGDPNRPTVMFFQASSIATLMAPDFRVKDAKTGLGEKIVNKAVLMTDGQDWVDQRRAIIGSFNINRFHDDMKRDMAGVIDGMIDGWKPKIERREPICISTAFSEMAYKVVTTVLMHETADDVDAVRGALTVLLTAEAQRFWRLKNPPADEVYEKRPELREARDVMRQVAGDMITRRKKALSVKGFDYEDDLLSQLIKRLGQSNHPETAEKILQMVATILAAGHETTGNAATGIAVSLSQNPPEWQRLVKASRTEFGGGIPDIDYLKELGTISRIMYEGLRLNSVVPFVSRILPQASLDGQPISEVLVPLDNGDKVRLTHQHRASISSWVAHRNPIYWPDPETFNSDRFLPEAIAERPPGSYLPLGGDGPRQCVAKDFAPYELTMAFTRFGQQFDALNVINPRDLSYEILLTARPKNPIYMLPTLKGEGAAVH